MEVYEMALIARLLDNVYSPSRGYQELRKARQIVRDELNQHHRECGACEGYGTQEDDEYLNCETCDGLGWVLRYPGGVQC